MNAYVRAPNWRISRMAVVRPPTSCASLFTISLRTKPRAQSQSTKLLKSRAGFHLRGHSIITAFSTPSNASLDDSNLNRMFSLRRRVVNTDPIFSSVEQLRETAGDGQPHAKSSTHSFARFTISKRMLPRTVNELAAAAHEFENVLHSMRTGSADPLLSNAIPG